MKLVTFQSYEALKSLINNGYLEADDKYINLDKAGYVYSFIIRKMEERIKKEGKSKYPLWCWVKCYNGVCPPRHKGDKVKGFDVKITFHKDKKDVFITDYERFSFLLNNMYIPDNLDDKIRFDELMDEYHVTRDELKAYGRRDKWDSHRTDEKYMALVKQVQDSFLKVIDDKGDVLQGCVWKINLDEVEKIEILSNDGYCYGSLNYVRSNGNRKKWIDSYYRKLK